MFLASFQKKQAEKDTQMLEHSSYNESVVMRVEGMKQSISVSLVNISILENTIIFYRFIFTDL